MDTFLSEADIPAMSASSRLSRLRPHRGTVVVLVLCLATTLMGTGFTAHLVDQSKQRVLRQQTAQAGLVLASLLNQTGAATGAVAATLRPDGSVDLARFAQTSRALRLPSGSGGAGVSATALVDLAAGRVLARNGDPLLNPLSAAGRQALANAAGRRTLALVGLSNRGGRRALGLLAPAGGATVAYVELPLTDSTTYVPDLPGKPFAGVDFAVYFGQETSADLVMTNSHRLPLAGRTARTAVSPTITQAWDPTTTRAASPLLLVMHPRTPLTGRTAALFPWMMLAMGLLAGLAVLVLLEKTQRRRDEALLLVTKLEERNAEVERAVDRQARAEEQLRQAQRLEAVGQLAGGIAHDFNNLLAVMFSYLGFLRTAGQDQPWLEDVDEVDKAAHRAADLTQQLLMFSRRDLASPDVLDVRELLRDRHRLLQRTLSEDIAVVLDVPDQPMLIRADAVELDQVVMNLAVNARDAMPDGGTLTLVLDEAPTEDSSCGIRLRVTDTGTGMDADVMDHAFEPFFTTKEVGRGTGLGMATVYGIVSRWGGSVTLDSTPGSGTTVTVLLPRTDGQLPPEPVAAAPAAHGARRAATVLLVEDEEGVRRASERILRQAGFDVVAASDGPEALALFEAHPVDVLVTDVVMPGGLSGADLAERLRLLRPDLPVVFTSGYGRDHLAHRGPLLSGTQLLRKPFPADTLVDVVRRSLDLEGALT
jgi:signal transduction histidine kinase/ActR/RegA family two-component response regulator